MSDELRDRITLRIYGPLPGRAYIPARDINARITSVRVTTQTPGGFGELEVGLARVERRGPRAALPLPVDVQDRSHVELYYSSGLLFAGMMQLATLDRTGFRATGYGLLAPAWATLDVPASSFTTTGRIVREALRRTPLLSPGTIDDPQTSQAWRDTLYSPVADVIDQAAASGGIVAGVGAVPWMFHVYDDQVASFRAQSWPSVPTYALDYDPETMGDLALDWSGVVDAVRALVNDVPTDWVYRAGVDPNDESLRRVTLDSSFPNLTIARTFIATYLDAHSLPVLTGDITLPADAQLKTGHGGYRRALYSRAGETLVIGSIDEPLGRAFIAGTDLDLFEDTVALSLSVPASHTLSGLLYDARRTSKALASKTDPVSNLPLRTRAAT